MRVGNWNHPLLFYQDLSASLSPLAFLRLWAPMLGAYTLTKAAAVSLTMWQAWNLGCRILYGARAGLEVTYRYQPGNCSCRNLTSAGFYQPEFRANLRLSQAFTPSPCPKQMVSLSKLCYLNQETAVYGLCLMDLSVLASALCPYAMIPHLASMAFEGNLCTILLIFYHKASTWNSCYLADIHQ